MTGTGYGENTWYDPKDHTKLHADLRTDFQAAYEAVNRRPHLQRSVLACAECQQIYAGDGAVDSLTPAPAYGRRVRLLLDLPSLATALGIPGDHQALYLWAEDGESVTLTVQCPPDETGDCPLAAAPATVLPTT